MERILTANQMKIADENTINNLGVSKTTLIERAGYAVAEEIIKRLKGGRVLVCIGKGNNGEDGRVISKILSATHGFTVATLNVSNGVFKIFDKKFDIIVDCVFGTGLNRDVEGRYKTAIEKINSSGAYVVSCDIASGLDSDLGIPKGIAVKANLTVAIQEYKLGHFLNDGPDYSGKVIAKDIGISIWEDEYVQKLNNDDVRNYFLPRKRNVNKGNFGKVAIIGGSKRYTGSAILSANSLCSLKTGVGYSYLFVPESLFSVYAGVNPECIISTLKDNDGSFVFDSDDLKSVLNFSSIAIGMGIGVNEENYKIIKYLLENYCGNLLIDADGLNTLSEFGTEFLKNKKCKVVLTPHIGEFARLIKCDKQEIINNGIALVKQFAKEYGVTVILKSATSIITDGINVYLNTTGNSGLSKAGSGDVLSGLTVGLISRDGDITELSAVSSYIFGLAGDFAVKKQNEYTVTASDVISAFPEAINSL